ncbi:putative fungistatic metabolite [Lachnellula subtilissima]|uniref:Putative fungistatic metabolite n=1 Tax=Lachnellula subtilissima TaxID=602034 RepID=A0A8H8RNG9_9HELO|nr:putative fungistatic metabolite [Lachnellula subtilissima]
MPSAVSALVFGLLASTSGAMSIRNDKLPVRQASAYSYLGCYTEGTDVRALGAASATNYTTMTVEKCASFCTPTYTLFGLEFGGECWCADVLGNGAVAAPATECNFACDGNATETCGASDRLNIYTTAGAAPAPPAHVLTAGAYSRIGCYTEGNGTRALSGATEVDYSTTGMTVEKCAAFCTTHGSALMGVEYGGECYCGGEAAFDASGSLAAPDADCDMLCNGSPSEFCGAGDRLDIYRSNSTLARSSR